MKDFSAIVTTTVKGEQRFHEQAVILSKHLHAPYVVRHKQAIHTLLARFQVDAVWVVGERLELHTGGEHPFFFHPGMSVTRIKRLERGEFDPLVEISQIQAGDIVLDCTLGLASDALVLSYAVGSLGRVTGVESVPWVARIVEDGLQKGYPELQALDAAMQRITVIQDEHYQVLSGLPDQSFDVVYFDPMFRQTVSTSTGIQALHALADPKPLSLETVKEAVRVAKKRVVLKERYHSSEFARLGFEKVKGGATSIAYGFIDCKRT